MGRKKRERPKNREGEFLHKKFEEWNKIWEGLKNIPYDPLNDPMLQTELERERKLKIIDDKIVETYNKKKAEGKLHELTNILYDGEV